MQPLASSPVTESNVCNLCAPWNQPSRPVGPYSIASPVPNVRKRNILRILTAVAVAAIITGCGFSAPHSDPMYAADLKRFISPADTETLARLVCECNPWRCDFVGRRPRGEVERVVLAARTGGRVSMADARLLGSPYECQASALGGAVAPGAQAKLRAFAATVRSVP